MDRTTSVVLSAMISWALLATPTHSVAAQERGEIDRTTRWLQEWSFLIGDWDLVEKRYGFDGNLIQINRGTAQFTVAMEGQRILETQTLAREGGERSSALQVFVYDPQADEVEIARTDSAHFGFWVVIGKPSQDGIDMREKYPDPNSEVTRRITYTRVDRNRFARRLEFSADKGETFFTRSEWLYSRNEHIR